MKKIKRITIILFFFCVFSFIILAYFRMKELSNYIIQNVENTKIKMEDVKFDGLCLKIKGIEINDLSGNKVGNVEEARVYIMPFLPSRINRINLIGAKLNLIQFKNGRLNIENILPEKNKVSRIYNVANIYLQNCSITYTNKMYDKDIKKELLNVSGNLSIAKNFEMKIKGEAIGKLTGQKEEIGLHFANVSSKKTVLASLFNRKIEDENPEYILQEFKFNNVDIDENLAQFFKLDFLKIQKAKLNGELKIEINKKKPQIKGSLDLIAQSFKYKDYADEIKKANFHVDLNNDKVKTKGQIWLKNDEKLNLNIFFDGIKKQLNADLDTEKISVENLKKYSLFKNLKLDIKGFLSSKLKFKLDFSKPKTVEIKELNLQAKSNSMKMYQFNFNNLNLNVQKKDQKLEINLNTDIKKDFILANAQILAEYNLDTKDIKAKYKLKNKTKGINLEDISGEISLKDFKKINLSILSKQMVGNLYLDKNKLKLKLDTKKEIVYNNGNINAKLNFKLLDSSYDFKTKNINAKISLNADGNYMGKYAKISVVSYLDKNILKSKGTISNGIVGVNIDGSTKLKSMEHRYKLSGSCDALTLMKIFNIDKKNKGNIPVDFVANLYGKNKDISLEYNIKSNKFAYIVDGYKAEINGYAKNILDNKKRDIKAKIKLGEVWFKYHRLNELEADLSYEDNSLIIFNIRNEFVSGDLLYNINSKEIYSKLQVDKFMLYSTYDIPDINVNVSKMYVYSKGRLDNLKAYFNLEPSEFKIKDSYVGHLHGEAKLENSVLKLNFKVNNNEIKGTYNINSKELDLRALLNQKLKDIVKIEGFNSDVDTKLHITGTPDKLHMDIEGKMVDIKYKDIHLPDITLDASYNNGNTSNILKTGVLTVSNLNIKDAKKQDSIYHTSFVMNLANLDINYVLKNKIFDLASLGENYSGKLKVSSMFKGNLDKFFGNLTVESDSLVLNGHKITNLLIDSQINQDGMNINQGYFEYEKNPVLIEGYAFFKPFDYMFRVVAENFNMDFLNIYPNISKVKGIANVNFVASKGALEGKIDIKDLSMKVQGIDIQNFDVNVQMNNKDININTFKGTVNNGQLNLKGQCTMPEIPDNANDLDKIKLGKVNLELDASHITLPIKGNEVVISSNLKLKGENLDGTLQINRGKIENLSFIDLLKQNKNKKPDNFITKKIKAILNNMLKRYVINVDTTIESPITIDVPGYLILKDIYGEIQGGAILSCSNGIPSIKGGFNVENGKFIINGNEFTVELLDVNMNDVVNGDFNPNVRLKAITTINGENIEILSNSKLKNLKFDFKSQSNKTKDEILKLLAFKGITFNSNSINAVGSTFINYATETAVNQFVSKFTNRIGKKIGLTKFEVGANIEEKNKLGINNFINNTYVQVHLQGKVSKKQKLYWNVKGSIPFSANKDKFKYDINLSYEFDKGLGATIGIKSINRLDLSENNKENNINFYTGINYSEKFQDFHYFIDDVKSKFEKREKLNQDKK